MNQTLLDHLLKLYPTAKRTTFRQMIQSRRIFINSQPARTLKQPINASDQIEVRDLQRRRVQGLPFRVLHQDEDILVIDKPAGLLTSTVPREKRPTAVAVIRKYLAEKEPKAQLGLIHRLDRDASGLLAFSKNHAAYLSLKQQFLHHDVERIYLAIVQGVPVPRKAMIDTHLIERADGSVHSSEKGQRAITYYETLDHAKGRAMLRVKLQTGKKHQIRVHLSERGVPIVNDPIYNDQKPQGRLMLAACELSFNHPRSGKRMTFKIDPPAEFTLHS
jgi:23S rRNA pseudouridine1911/1915/1917 synthase